MSEKRVALLISSNVVGGHEFQAAALAESLAKHVELTVFVNQPEHARLFESAGLNVRLLEQQLLTAGPLPQQFIDGWRRRKSLRAHLTGFDHAIVSAGAVEAGIAAGVALRGYLPVTLYLPVFYDRVPVWGRVGHLYNCLLGTSCRLFDRIITINKIQARIIKSFTRQQTLVVRNLVRPVCKPGASGQSRLAFIGRLDSQKRVGELLQWLDFEGTPYQTMLIIGDGPLRAELETLAKSLKHLRCTFHGWMNPAEQDSLLGSNDILVLNSLIEGEPLVIREAQLRGMEVVARNIRGVRGVTSKMQRFSTPQNLENRLRMLARLDAQQVRKPHTPFDRRNSQIQLLLKVFDMHNA